MSSATFENRDAMLQSLFELEQHLGVSDRIQAFPPPLERLHAGSHQLSRRSLAGPLLEGRSGFICRMNHCERSGAHLIRSVTLSRSGVGVPALLRIRVL